jgi:hypothetical protein
VSSKHFKIKLIKVESFIDRIPEDKIIHERDMRQYNGAVGKILVHYAQADNELMKEFPDFDKYQKLIKEAEEIINNLTVLESIDKIRKNVIGE